MNYDATYRDLGWANGWRETPAEVQACIDAGHNVRTKHPPGHRSGEHVVWCPLCRYVYRYDSSG